MCQLHQSIAKVVEKATCTSTISNRHSRSPPPREPLQHRDPARQLREVRRRDEHRQRQAHACSLTPPSPVLQPPPSSSAPSACQPAPPYRPGLAQPVHPRPPPHQSSEEYALRKNHQGHQSHGKHRREHRPRRRRCRPSQNSSIAEAEDHDDLQERDHTVLEGPPCQLLHHIPPHRLSPLNPPEAKPAASHGTATGHAPGYSSGDPQGGQQESVAHEASDEADAEVQVDRNGGVCTAWRPSVRSALTAAPPQHPLPAHGSCTGPPPGSRRPGHVSTIASVARDSPPRHSPDPSPCPVARLFPIPVNRAPKSIISTSPPPTTTAAVKQSIPTTGPVPRKARPITPTPRPIIHCAATVASAHLRGPVRQAGRPPASSE